MAGYVVTVTRPSPPYVVPESTFPARSLPEAQYIAARGIPPYAPDGEAERARGEIRCFPEGGGRTSLEAHDGRTSITVKPAEDPKLTDAQLAMLRGACEDERHGFAFVGRGQDRTAKALVALGYGVYRKAIPGHTDAKFYVEDAGRERWKREAAKPAEDGGGAR